MKQLLMLVVGVVLTGGISACSKNRTKLKQNNDSDRSSSIVYTDSLSFISAANDTLATISIAIADNENQRNEGLMDVNKLPANNGMLFIFDHPQQLSFWMANTPLPLDIIFVDKNKKIVRIHHSTKPFTQKNFSSGKPALYAIETNGGFCINHDIQEGTRVIFGANAK